MAVAAAKKLVIYLDTLVYLDTLATSLLGAWLLGYLAYGFMIHGQFVSGGNGREERQETGLLTCALAHLFT
jgi:hypothetical protein